MGFLILDCPHCSKKDVFFAQKGYFGYKYVDESDQYIVFFTCGACNQGVMADVRGKHGNTPAKFDNDYQKYGNFTVLDIYPKAKSAIASEHVPNDIANYYKQAIDNLERGFWDSAALMGGKVLEVTFKTKYPDITGNFGRLVDRINELASLHILTEPMKDWAHQVRLIRNDAAHSIDMIQEQDAKDLMSFVEMFLMYVFTLPAMLEARRNRGE